LLPSGARPRQLAARTLLPGMLLAAAGGRPAHLTRVHQALASLPGDQQRRLGILTDWEDGPHLLTCRQAEYAFGLMAAAPGKGKPGGLPSGDLASTRDDLLEASVPARLKGASASLAADWTDLESLSRPRRAGPPAAPAPRRPGGTARTT
jgi:hypothetical protein